MPEVHRSDENVTLKRGSRWWLGLLALPYLGLCFPHLYTRSVPVLFGLPFFYWYQFAWVLITSAILGIVYRVRATF